MRKSHIHYLWIGPPKFREGGQDIVGLETLWMQAEKTGDTEIMQRTHFCCLDEHVTEYSDYFVEKGIPTLVMGLESWLLKTVAGQQNSFAEAVLNHYENLSAAKTETIAHRVCVKEFGALLLLYWEGGYVLDSNVMVYSLPENPGFPEFDSFHAPVFWDRDGNPTLDIWMQYCPKGHSLAKKILESYFEKFYRIISLDNETDFLSKKSMPAVYAVEEFILKENNISAHAQKHPEWHFDLDEAGNPVSRHLNLVKEYYNTHWGWKNMLPQHFSHACNAQPERLRFDLEHGIFVDELLSKTEVYGENIFLHNQTMLHCVIARWVALCSPNAQSSWQDREKKMRYRQCAEILLEQGANMNLNSMQIPGEEKKLHYSVFDLVKDESEIEESEVKAFLDYHAAQQKKAGSPRHSSRFFGRTENRPVFHDESVSVSRTTLPEVKTQLNRSAG